MLFMAVAYGLSGKHTVSLNVSCQMINSRLQYIKIASPQKSVQLLQSPNIYLIAHDDNTNNLIMTNSDLNDILLCLMSLSSNFTHGNALQQMGRIESKFSAISNKNVLDRQNPNNITAFASKLPGMIGMTDSSVRLFVDDRLTHLTRDRLVQTATILAQNTNKQFEIIVIVKNAPPTDTQIKDHITQLVGSGDTFVQEVSSKVHAHESRDNQDCKHSALMGGVGVSVGYHYHTAHCIFNLRAGVDRLWGKFRETHTQHTDTEKNPSLGYGLTLGGGMDYKVTPAATFGFEGGMRFSQFVMGHKADKTKRTACWFAAPYAQMNFTIYPGPKWSMCLFSGYQFARTFKTQTAGGDIPHYTGCKIDGVYGGLRLSRYWG